VPVRCPLLPLWCGSNGVTPPLCEVGDVLSFLQSLLEKGVAFSTIKVNVVAVSAGYIGCDGGAFGVFNHPLVKRFLRGARLGKVVTRVLTPLLSPCVGLLWMLSHVAFTGLCVCQARQ